MGEVGRREMILERDWRKEERGREEGSEGVREMGREERSEGGGVGG